jgi:nucleotide-binding universal stress UspA family protein
VSAVGEDALPGVQDGPARHIVVGVDGSASSLDALRWAAAQADRTGASLDAVIAWQYPYVYGGFPVSDSVDWRLSAQRTLDDAVAAALGEDGPKVTTTVREGDAAGALLAASATAELLVVGHRGHGGFTELLLGSVSQRVVTHATCPVVVIRHRADG